MDRVFLDANVLFSAAYRPTTHLRRLWTLDEVRLLTSEFAVEEARRNLPASCHADLDALLTRVDVIGGVPADAAQPAEAIELAAKDVPILQGAMMAAATHLLTGDRQHFGNYFGHRVNGVLILRPAVYLSSREESVSEG